MASGNCDLHAHNGGQFVNGQMIEYKGGKEDVGENIDLDFLGWFD